MTSSRRSAARRALHFASVYWRAALGAGYALTFGVGARRNRALLTTIAQHFGYDHREREPALPRVPLEQVVPPGSRTELRELQGVDGNTSVTELVVLASLAAQLDARRLFEIGTFDGRTAVNLAANAAPDATVFTLDLPPAAAAAGAATLDVDADDRKYIQSPRSGARIAGSELAPRIQRLFGDSATFDFTPHAGTIDLCFVDGSHAYSYVVNDSAHALRMVRPGGVVLWHDYANWDGVTEALDELYRTDAAFAALQWIDGTSLAMLRKPAATIATLR
jgi:predicted O-methyltransferase YrrM